MFQVAYGGPPVMCAAGVCRGNTKDMWFVLFLCVMCTHYFSTELGKLSTIMGPLHKWIITSG